jgi:hypothetical protein
MQAHRVSWILHHGSIPDGMSVCHRCDTPACVRPDHLFLGTQLDNMRDSTRKRRNGKYRYPNNFHKGSQCWKAVLTDEDVRAIRSRLASGAGQHQLAREYGVAPPTINRIAKRVTWKHVE